MNNDNNNDFEKCCSDVNCNHNHDMESETLPVKILIKLTAMAIECPEADAIRQIEILAQLKSMMDNTPAQADEMIKQYFKFLYYLAMEDDKRLDIWMALPEDMKALFNSTVQRISSGNDYTDLFSQLAQVAAMAKIAEDGKKNEVINYFDNMLANVHEDTPEEVLDYYKFLHSFIKEEGQDMNLWDKLSDDLKDVFISTVNSLDL